MKKVKVSNDRFRVKKSVIIITFFLFFILIARLCYLCLVDYKVGDTTISMFIKNRNTEEEIIMPDRGTIFDSNGNILANDVISYTLVAYLSSDRVDANGKKNYVEDFDKTSDGLASVLGVESSAIKEILDNGKENNKYQVEFGTMGKGISELTKEAIDKLNLQGIDFTREVKRYYPNGDFASYLIGYTVGKDDDSGNKWITGEMGIEEYYNEDLTGKSGYVTYEKDKYGYKIANGREYVEPAENGSNVYLTIDSNIQLFVENAVKSSQEASNAEWTLMAVMDAKTGAILGYSSTPSFDPNLRNMTSYLDPMLQEAYEPGSTMKIYSYMCAIDSGNYDGDTMYDSGSKTYESEIEDDKVTIADWNKKGWGKISYDDGFALSSNIAVANIVENVINKEELRSCYTKYGFGNKTGFTLKREDAGSIDFKYQVEAATAGYGQGIMTTPLQHLQALTAIANDGTMIKPYIVSKVVDSNNKTIYEGKKEVVGNIASHDTIEKMKKLMASVINGNEENSTGYKYYMDGYSLIGKTGTAQIYDYSKGRYMTGESQNIYSFSGMFPEDNPEIIVYMANRIPQDTTNYLSTSIQDIEKNITKYLNIEESSKEKEKFAIKSYANKNTDNIKNKLQKNNIKVLVLGNGNKVIDQYPSRGNTIYEEDLVVLKTNNYDKTMIDLTGYSYKEAINILKLMDVEYDITGTGYVTSQSVEVGSKVDGKVTLELKEKW